MKKAAHWTVIHMTGSGEKAERILSALREEGFMVSARRMSRAMSGNENDYEILCIDSEAKEAHQLLIERGLLL